MLAFSPDDCLPACQLCLNEMHAAAFSDPFANDFVLPTDGSQDAEETTTGCTYGISAQDAQDNAQAASDLAQAQASDKYSRFEIAGRIVSCLPLFVICQALSETKKINNCFVRIVRDDQARLMYLKVHQRNCVTPSYLKEKLVSALQLCAAQCLSDQQFDDIIADLNVQGIPYGSTWYSRTNHLFKSHRLGDDELLHTPETSGAVGEGACASRDMRNCCMVE